MTLYKQWIDLMEGQSEETFESFWKEYSETETRVYEHILSHKDAHLSTLKKYRRIQLWIWT